MDTCSRPEGRQWVLEVEGSQMTSVGGMIPGGRHAGSGALVGRDGCGNAGFGHTAECPDVVVAVSTHLAKF